MILKFVIKKKIKLFAWGSIFRNLSADFDETLGLYWCLNAGAKFVQFRSQSMMRKGVENDFRVVQFCDREIPWEPRVVLGTLMQCSFVHCLGLCHKSRVGKKRSAFLGATSRKC